MRPRRAGGLRSSLVAPAALPPHMPHTRRLRSSLLSPPPATPRPLSLHTATRRRAFPPHTCSARPPPRRPAHAPADAAPAAAGLAVVAAVRYDCAGLGGGGRAKSLRGGIPHTCPHTFAAPCSVRSPPRPAPSHGREPSGCRGWGCSLRVAVKRNVQLRGFGAGITYLYIITIFGHGFHSAAASAAPPTGVRRFAPAASASAPFQPWPNIAL